MRILIVDDEPDILLMMRLTLEAEGFTTALAADGESALDHLRRERFDLMLLDVMMPVLDGWGVLERLGEVTSPPHVIVVSAKTTQADLARASGLGAADYVTKPFAFGDLMVAIKRVTAGLEAG
jgi:two-component system copper resistance phosphate regulon response regulator CusR